VRTLAQSALIISLSAALLAGCGASQPSFGQPSRTQADKIDSSIGYRQGAMVVGAYARSLLYISNLESVNVYTYPRGKPLGSLGVGGYLCSDSFGNVIVTGAEGISYIWVYPHGGGQPSATLYNPESPGGCSVYRSSEDIAVASADAGSVVIFPYNPKRGWRLAHDYKDPNMRAGHYCTYDPQGNLFLDGYSASATSFILAELPRGSSTFTTITLDHVVHSPGSMQWDGKDLIVEDAGQPDSGPAVIYRFAISGSAGHRVSTTRLTESMAEGQFLIQGRTAIGPVSSGSVRGVGFWRFPAGGAPVRILSTYSSPSAEALSLK
jgi:hypothetical protein